MQLNTKYSNLENDEKEICNAILNNLPEALKDYQGLLQSHLVKGAWQGTSPSMIFSLLSIHHNFLLVFYTEIASITGITLRPKKLKHIFAIGLFGILKQEANICFYL